MVKRGHYIDVAVEGVIENSNVDVVVYANAHRNWAGAVLQEVKQIHPDTGFGAHKLRRHILKADGQLGGVSAKAVVTEPGAGVRSQVIIDARSMTPTMLNSMISKSEIRQLLGTRTSGGIAGLWGEIDGLVDDIFILTPKATMAFKKPAIGSLSLVPPPSFVLPPGKLVVADGCDSCYTVSPPE